MAKQFFSFSTFLALKLTKENFLFQVQPLKMWNKKIVVLWLGLQAKFAQALRGPAPSKKATDQSNMLDLGSHNSLVQNDICPKISFKITPPYWGLTVS